MVPTLHNENDDDCVCLAELKQKYTRNISKQTIRPDVDNFISQIITFAINDDVSIQELSVSYRCWAKLNRLQIVNDSVLVKAMKRAGFYLVNLSHDRIGWKEIALIQ